MNDSNGLTEEKAYELMSRGFTMIMKAFFGLLRLILTSDRLK